jgi:hypothetical protein
VSLLALADINALPIVRFAPAAVVRAKSAIEALSGNRLPHPVIGPITTIKIHTVAPELRSGRVGAIEAIGDLEE